MRFLVIGNSKLLERGSRVADAVCVIEVITLLLCQSCFSGGVVCD